MRGMSSSARRFCSKAKGCCAASTASPGRRWWQPCAPSWDFRTFRWRVRIIHEASGGTYGVPRVHVGLHRRGFPVSRKRVARSHVGGHEDVTPRPLTVKANAVQGTAPIAIRRIRGNTSGQWTSVQFCGWGSSKNKHERRDDSGAQSQWSSPACGCFLARRDAVGRGRPRHRLRSRLPRQAGRHVGSIPPRRLRWRSAPGRPMR